MNRDRFFQLIFPLLGFILLAFSLWILNQKLSQYNLDDVLQSLSAIDKIQLTQAIAFTIFGYLIISTYDLLAFDYLARNLPKFKILLVTFIVYGISNTTGFTLLIGGAIRYYFYSRWGISAKDIAKITAFGNVSFWVGLLGTGGVACFIDPLNLAQYPRLSLIPFQGIGILLMSVVGVYLVFCARQKSLKIRNKVITFPCLKISLFQLLIFTSDWAVAAATLYVLLPSNTNLSYPAFFSIYLLAMNAAIISHVPSGLGVFETVILFLLPEAVSTPDALSSFLLYRTIRFLLPLIIALSSVGLLEVDRRLKVK